MAAAAVPMKYRRSAICVKQPCPASPLVAAAQHRFDFGDKLKTSGDNQGSATVVRYDAITVALHWITAALVVALFGMTLWWNYAPRSIGFRFELEDLHVSLGLLLAGTVFLRLIWRASLGRRLPPADQGLRQRLAQSVHVLLYCGLAAQIALGIALRALQGADLSLFGWFSVPALLEKNRPAAELVDALHYWAGWALVMLAGGHAIMALFHRYWLNDTVLRRMLPDRR